MHFEILQIWDLPFPFPPGRDLGGDANLSGIRPPADPKGVPFGTF